MRIKNGKKFYEKTYFACSLVIALCDDVIVLQIFILIATTILHFGDHRLQWVPVEITPAKSVHLQRSAAFLVKIDLQTNGLR